ncbi:MAG: transcriptional regulator [Rhodobacteraceae bacterium CG17_big_fil_post_rev_8_21_14_2_50_63_15]|nr:MAG: transcriptional regulator [Rhodobacteraceae bacterium CG17_big_fil_post_rev_8_21_14_2_50_63_15]
MITGLQIRAARALLRIDQKTLARMAGLSVPTIQRMEANDSVVGGVVDSLTRVVAAIESAGVDLIADGATSSGGGRGARLRHSEVDRPDDLSAEAARGSE